MTRLAHTTVFPLLAFLLLTTAGCGALYRGIDCGDQQHEPGDAPQLVACHDLTEQGRLFSEVAWTYFENNYHPNTGLVNAAENYPYTSIGEIAAYLSALMAAHQMEIIDDRNFCQRTGKLIEWLNAMELYAGDLPNLIYNTSTGRMVGFDMQPGSAGFSSIDIGRLLIWLKALKEEYPLFAEGVDRAVLRWNFCMAINKNGQLQSGLKAEGKTDLRVEGRLGWEEYAARGYELWGLDVKSSVAAPLRYISIYDKQIPYDPRTSVETGGPIYLTGTPFLLEGLEFDWNTGSLPKGHDRGDDALDRRDIAKSVYMVQEERYRREGIMTARSENGVDKPPYAIIGAITAEGRLWPTISRTGEMRYDLSVFSTRAIFGMWSLWNTPYSRFILAAASCCFFEEGRGWYEGRYEKNWRIVKVVSLETNAMVLESILHKLKGQLIRLNKEPSYIDFYVNKPLPMHDYPHCLPQRKRED
ncbi:DUF3131 domain-containing protein [Pseudodesulfovibrio sp. JC047]|uniref:DUF3131 domain-containing protein n=1 Tax=Pseudodesulfovibrio sp. JC047 TaxID=2683199 RepID=UPI0013D23EB4|nr:DUF3131 domain-containing protein [Pseudodesulfovibrio sp. JC047]NDV19258.1 DUF3131 domain-containing protein [Pseudodesulfovibrio sp. JC047]